MKNLLFAIALSGACAMRCVAAEPATQPVGNLIDSSDTVMPLPGQPSGSEDGTPHHRGDRLRMGMGQRPLAPLTAKDISDAMQFMQEHSPKRFEAIQALPEGITKTTVKNAATKVYLNSMRQAKEDPDLYSIIVKRSGYEDNIFGLLAQLHSEPAENHDQTKVLLREQVGELFDVVIKERKMRLERLDRTVKAEEKNLASDLTNRDKMVNDLFDNVINDKKGLLPTLNLIGPNGASDRSGAGKASSAGRDHGGQKDGGESSNP